MRFEIKTLTTESVRCLCEHGLQKYDAEILVDSFVEADLCGVSTHGIRMLPSYIKKIDSKQFFLEDISVLKSTSAFTLINANNSIGAISALKASKIAVEKAKKSGLHVVFSRNSNTFGPAFYYTEYIAKQGMIGFACCNVPASMPAFNGLEPMLGTNPLSFACPSKSKGIIIMDMATSIVAKSKFETARVNNEKLPLGWALDKNGNPTTDPLEAIKGFILPMAGFKGYGIAMAIDIISGLLSGAGYLNRVNKFYSQNGECMNVGQLFVAIDPSQVYDEDFYSDADKYIDILRNSKVVEGKTIAIPGDDRNKARRQNVESGIEISEADVVKLEEVFNKKLVRVIT